jgi:hypothetical protein
MRRRGMAIATRTIRNHATQQKGVSRQHLLELDTCPSLAVLVTNSQKPAAALVAQPSPIRTPAIEPSLLTSLRLNLIGPLG